MTDRATGTAEAPEPAANNDVVRRAGRGGLAVSAAKIYFIILGLVQNILLPRVLGAAGYGGLSRVFSFTSIAYNSIVTTSIQGASRTVARAAEHERPLVIRQVLKFHLIAAPVLSLLMWATAPLVCGALNALHLLSAMRIMAGVLFFYGLYAPLVGVLNGQQRFGLQAGLDICFATLRTSALIAGAYWFQHARHSGVDGAVIGFVAVTAVITVVAVPIAGLGKAGGRSPSPQSYLSFILPLLAGQILLNSLLQLDINLLGRFAADSARNAGLPVEQADALVGSYRATQNFSFLPYQLLLSVTFVLFPLLARAQREGKTQEVAAYTSSGIRLALVIAGAMISVTAGIPGALLRLVYRPEIAEPAVEAMGLLTLGFGAFAILGIFTTVLTSLQRERSAAMVTGVAVILVVVLALVLVRGQPFGVNLLWRMAIATTSGLFVATIAAGTIVRRAAGALVSPWAVGRVATALAGCILVGRWLAPHGAVATLGSAMLIVVSYLVALVLLRELNRSDLERILTVLRKRESRKSAPN